MIDEFLQTVGKEGLAKPNLFKVSVTFPEGIRNGESQDFFSIYEVNTRDAIRVNLFCESTELPGKAIVTNPIKTHGAPVKIPYNVQYEDVPMVFYVGDDMQEKKFFDAWMSMIVDPNTGDLNYFDEYTSTIQLTQLSADGNETYSVILKKAYPVVMSPLTLSMAESNNIHRLPVVFAFRKWEYAGTGSQTQGAANFSGVQELDLNYGNISTKLLGGIQNRVSEITTSGSNVIKSARNFYNLFK